MRKLPILKELEMFGPLGLFIDNRKSCKRIKIFRAGVSLNLIERYVTKKYPNIKLSHAINPNGTMNGYYNGLVLKIKLGDPLITVTTK